MEVEASRAKRRRMELQDTGSAELQTFAFKFDVVEDPVVVRVAVSASVYGGGDGGERLSGLVVLGHCDYGMRREKIWQGGN